MLSKKKKTSFTAIRTTNLPNHTQNAEYRIPPHVNMTRSDDTTSSKKKLARRGFGRHVIQSLPTHFPFIESCSSCCLKVCAQ